MLVRHFLRGFLPLPLLAVHIHTCSLHHHGIRDQKLRHGRRHVFEGGVLALLRHLRIVPLNILLVSLVTAPGGAGRQLKPNLRTPSAWTLAFQASWSTVHKCRVAISKSCHLGIHRLVPSADIHTPSFQKRLVNPLCHIAPTSITTSHDVHKKIHRLAPLRLS